MNNLVPIKFKEECVITTELLAEVYGTDTKNISKNFSRNIGKFEENKHYYLLEGEELKEFKGNRLLDDNLKFASKLYLWTERGANRHCKILDTDKAWEQFDNLEETYFKVKEGMQPKLPTTYIEALEQLLLSEKEKEQLKLTNKVQEQQINELKPKADYTDIILKSNKLVTITQIAKDYGMSGQKMNSLLKERKVQYSQSGQWLLYSKHQDKGFTHSMTAYYGKENSIAKMYTKWTQKGRLFIYDLLKEDGILPTIEQVA